jgi:hypothetical protein
MANTIVDVTALEATIDIKHLPRQDLSSEVYQLVHQSTECSLLGVKRTSDFGIRY